MKELQVIISDDLIFTRTGERVPAEETVVITVDGMTRELDLTAQNARELRDSLGPWLEAGHAPEKKPKPEILPKPAPGAHPASRAQRKAMRDWADACGLRSDDGQRPIYITPAGSYYYSYKLRAMYATHLAATT